MALTNSKIFILIFLLQIFVSCKSTDSTAYIEGEINDQEVSFSVSELDAYVSITEKASSDPNEVYDGSDEVSITLRDYDGSEQIEVKIFTNGYVNLEAGEVYELEYDDFDPERPWNVFVEHCSATCDYSDEYWYYYSVESYSIMFTQLPTTVDSLVSGQLEIFLINGDSLFSEFSANLTAYISKYE